MATFTISGNVVAVNARLRLRSTAQIQPEVFTDTYSDASGNYSFTGVAVGNYQLVADLNECSTTYLPTLYSYTSPVLVSVVASNITSINLAPVLLNASNVPTQDF